MTAPTFEMLCGQKIPLKLAQIFIRSVSKNTRRKKAVEPLSMIEEEQRENAEDDAMRGYEMARRRVEIEQASIQHKEREFSDIEYMAFEKVCKEKAAQILLKSPNWECNDQLVRIFRGKMRSIVQEEKRDKLYADLRDCLSELSEDKVIEYRPGSGLFARGEKVYGAFSFVPIMEEYKPVDDADCTYLSQGSPLGFDHGALLKMDLRKKEFILIFAKIVWEHISQHEMYRKEYTHPPVVSIRTLQTYLFKLCSEELLAYIGDKVIKLLSSDYSAYNEYTNEDEQRKDLLEEEYHKRYHHDDAKEIEVLHWLSKANKLTRSYLSIYEQYALTICLNLSCGLTPTEIDRLLGKGRKAANSLLTAVKKTHFWLNHDLHPEGENYDHAKMTAFLRSLGQACIHNILPGGCPKHAPECNPDAVKKRNQKMPCADITQGT